MLGILYIVATPIGNLADLSPRAVQTLRDVALIAAEDTRHTRGLLAHAGIHTPLMSCHDHNESQVVDRLLGILRDEKSIALVSDAGTPTVADPGYRVVRAAIDAGFQVTPIPGPCAIITALSASGLPGPHFTFFGFPPDKSGKRKTFFEHAAEFPHTTIFYVARWDIAKYLREMQNIFGETRPAVVARELTKSYEEFQRGSLQQLVEWAEKKEVKGECVILVSGKSAE